MKEYTPYSLVPEYQEKITATPYVVSGDIYGLLRTWATKHEFILPSPAYFTDLRTNFSQTMQTIFPGFELVPEDELVQGVAELIDKSGLVPISLDKVYYPASATLDITRITNEGQRRGLGRRTGSPSLLEQFRNLQSLGVKEVALVDDVIFFGEVIGRVSDVLETAGIQTRAVFAGIGIGEGLELLRSKGKKVECVRTYKKVIDEVCERDCYIGVPLSGRLISQEHNIGAPYIRPFGDPETWASIPSAWQDFFSQFCIRQSISLFTEIEKASQKPVLCSNLDRNVRGIPRSNNRFVDELSQFLDK